MFGKFYAFYSIKATFLSAVALFEIGSAVCGAAPSSVAFIIGRAIAGVGAAGIFSGVVSANSLRACLWGMAVYLALGASTSSVA